MPKFEAGQLANMARADGTEATVRVTGFASNDDVFISELEENGSRPGSPRLVNSHELLRTKGPFFDVRGLVYTTSSVYHGEEGEIVSIGHGPQNQIFYHIKFANGATQWFSENDVLINDEKSSSLDVWAKLGNQ